MVPVSPWCGISPIPTNFPEPGKPAHVFPSDVASIHPLCREHELRAAPPMSEGPPARQQSATKLAAPSGITPAGQVRTETAWAYVAQQRHVVAREEGYRMGESRWWILELGQSSYICAGSGCACSKASRSMCVDGCQRSWLFSPVKSAPILTCLLLLLGLEHHDCVEVPDSQGLPASGRLME